MIESVLWNIGSSRKSLLCSSHCRRTLPLHFTQVFATKSPGTCIRCPQVVSTPENACRFFSVSSSKQWSLRPRLWGLPVDPSVGCVNLAMAVRACVDRKHMYCEEGIKVLILVYTWRGDRYWGTEYFFLDGQVLVFVPHRFAHFCHSRVLTGWSCRWLSSQVGRRWRTVFVLTTRLDCVVRRCTIPNSTLQNHFCFLC